jgi:hypothetical protein
MITADRQAGETVEKSVGGVLPDESVAARQKLKPIEASQQTRESIAT